MTQDQVRKLIMKSKYTSCELDPIPTWLLKLCVNELLPIVTKIINTSLLTPKAPRPFKSTRIKPLIKKPDLDPDIFKNFRPVANEPYLAKLTEKCADGQMEGYLTENNLHEQHQSAYRKFHSTETAFFESSK